MLVENVEDGREYTVEEIHNSETEISQISVQDPLRYLKPYLEDIFFTSTHKIHSHYIVLNQECNVHVLDAHKWVWFWHDWRAMQDQ